MNTSDYKKKMKNLLSDKADKKLENKDPTNTIAQNTKILMEKNNIPSKIKSTLKPTNSLSPRLGLPKVHKPNPLRLIVSVIHFLTYNFPLPSTNTTISH